MGRRNRDWICPKCGTKNWRRNLVCHGENCLYEPNPEPTPPASTMPSPTAGDPETWLATIWHALDEHRTAYSDAEWDEIATAMAWIKEEISP